MKSSLIPMVSSGNHLPVGAWDLMSLLSNTKTMVQTGGGLLLMLMGTAGLVWGGVLLIKKLMSHGQQGAQQHSWAMILILIMVGGAFAVGGFSLIQQIGSGGQKTITDLGTGAIVFNLHALGSFVGLR